MKNSGTILKAEAQAAGGPAGRGSAVSGKARTAAGKQGVRHAGLDEKAAHKLFLAGNDLYQNGDLSAAKEKHAQAADLGSSLAQFALRTMYPEPDEIVRTPIDWQAIDAWCAENAGDNIADFFSGMRASAEDEAAAFFHAASHSVRGGLHYAACRKLEEHYRNKGDEKTAGHFRELADGVLRYEKMNRENERRRQEMILQEKEEQEKKLQEELEMADRERRMKNWRNLIFAVLGALVVYGLGSLIAENWDAITSFIMAVLRGIWYVFLILVALIVIIAVKS